MDLQLTNKRAVVAGSTAGHRQALPAHDGLCESDTLTQPPREALSSAVAGSAPEVRRRAKQILPRRPHSLGRRSPRPRLATTRKPKPSLR
jgi:hypothetical protein